MTEQMAATAAIADTIRPRPAFEELEWGGGTEDADPKFPVSVLTLEGESANLTSSATHCVYVLEGRATISGGQVPAYVIYAGMYAQIPWGCTILPGYQSRVMVLTQRNFRGAFMIGGPVEWRGRMRYIDGCTDSLLVPPTMYGDPCLNLLYFPPGIDQTAHTHPSSRLGIILSGRGECDYDAGERGPGGEIRMRTMALRTGMAFNIRAEGVHKFRTGPTQDMRVLAYHPDSDFGPKHESHPMLNRTIINGISAADPAREQYRTKE